MVGSTVPSVGYSFFRHPSNPVDGEISLFHLSDRGSIHRLDLTLTTSPSEAEQTPITISQSVEWPVDLQETATRAIDMRSDVGPLGARDLTEVDLHPAYDSEDITIITFVVSMFTKSLDIFRIHREETQLVAEQTGEAVYDLLEQMPSYWQEADVPVEHMITT